MVETKSEGLKIRIRLKAYDHRVIDQSANKSLIPPSVPVLTSLVQYLCQLSVVLLLSSSLHTFIKLVVRPLR